MSRAVSPVAIGYRRMASVLAAYYDQWDAEDGARRDTQAQAGPPQHAGAGHAPRRPTTAPQWINAAVSRPLYEALGRRPPQPRRPAMGPARHDRRGQAGAGAGAHARPEAARLDLRPVRRERANFMRTHLAAGYAAA